MFGDAGKIFNILLIGDLKDEDCKTLKDIINEYSVYKIQIIFCLDDALKVLDEHNYSIVMIDMKVCDVGKTVQVAQRIRSRNESCVIVTIFHETCDSLFDFRIIEVPIDDFIKAPLVADHVKEKLLLWSLKYRRRYMCSITVQEKMDEYNKGISRMKELENQLRILIGIESVDNGRSNKEISSTEGQSGPGDCSTSCYHNPSVE